MKAPIQRQGCASGKTCRVSDACVCVAMVAPQQEIAPPLMFMSTNRDGRKKFPGRCGGGTFPGRSAARSEAEWCAADPGPFHTKAYCRNGPGSAAHRFTLRRIRDTQAAQRQKLRAPDASQHIASRMYPACGTYISAAHRVNATRGVMRRESVTTISLPMERSRVCSASLRCARAALRPGQEKAPARTPGPRFTSCQLLAIHVAVTLHGVKMQVVARLIRIGPSRKPTGLRRVRTRTRRARVRPRCRAQVWLGRYRRAWRVVRVRHDVARADRRIKRLRQRGRTKDRRKGRADHQPLHHSHIVFLHSLRGNDQPEARVPPENGHLWIAAGAWL